MAFGAYGPFPIRFGGGKRPIETEHEALLETYKSVFDIERGGEDSGKGLPWVEAYAEAAVLGIMWAGSQRGANQRTPLKLLEGLPVWEEACGLTPGVNDPLTERRAEVAAKFRSFGNNAEPDIRDVCVAMMGSNFVELSWVSDADDVTYWPGFNPGPPGLEWFSRRCIAFVEVTKTGLTQDAFDRKVGKLAQVLDSFLPAWMTFEIFTVDTNGTDEGFILDYSSLDEVGL